MSEKEAEGLVWLIVIAIITIVIIVIKIQIGVIHAYQNMFWISLIAIPIFFILFIIFLFCGIFKKDADSNWGWYSEPEFFDKTMLFIFAGGFFILSLVSLCFMPYCYERGYSDEALQRLTELENQLQSMEQLQSIFTGEIVWDITNQALDETVDNLCKDPNYPCNQIKQSVKIYKEIKGAKDDADQIAMFFGFYEKASQIQNSNQ